MTSYSPLQIVSTITNSSGRKFLFHNTDLRNIESIAYTDTLYSCQSVDPSLSYRRRTEAIAINFNGFKFVANDQLKIHDEMMAPGVSKKAFRTFLDKHVFFWATHTDCKRMYKSYERKQPKNKRVVFKFNASDLLLQNFPRVKLCKYNSGSNPLNIRACNYRKGPHIFLPARLFLSKHSDDVPTSPAQIREILIEEKVKHISKYIDTIYCHNKSDLPSHWKKFYKHISSFWEEV